jgi:hypothetical protein
MLLHEEEQLIARKYFIIRKEERQMTFKQHDFTLPRAWIAAMVQPLISRQ